MRTLLKNSFVVFALAGALFLGSCKKDDPALPDNNVAFESDQLGTSASETQLTINVNITRAVSTASSVVVSLEPVNAAYTTDFTTEPAAASNSLTLSVPANTTSASFVVKKTAGVPFDGDEKIKFTIQTVASGLKIGEKNVLTLSFAEIVAAQGAMEINGGGPTYPNKVFIDFSGARQTAVARTSWDLAFSSTDDYRVLLNSPNGMLAYKLTKTDMAAVNNSDTAVLRNRLSLSALQSAIFGSPVPTWPSTSLSWMDAPSGDLNATAIAAVSATASDNAVYIINRGSGPGSPAPALGWKKIKIIRNGSNYTIQHADINSSTFTSTNITKDANYRFNYFSFTTGAVAAGEPATKKWDIAWNGFTNKTASGEGYDIPYYFQDFVIQNSLVGVAVVSTSTVTYDAFAEANLTGLTYNTTQTGIGSSWRAGGGPSTAPSVIATQFYIVKDPDGNYYKLRFTAITTSGERGRPQIEFKLVKKA